MEANEQPDDVKEELKKLKKRHEAMKAARINFQSHWQEVMTFVVPRKEDVISTRAPGDQRGYELYDSTAIMANLMLAGALHSMLTNMAVRFFDLSMMDTNLDDDDGVKNWLQDTAETMFTAITNSNFHTEVHELYIDLGAIGTACQFIDEDDDMLVRFNTRAMKEIFVMENTKGVIDIVHREFPMKARQIVQDWGKAKEDFDLLPNMIKSAYEKGDEQDLYLVHAVEPAEEKVNGIFPVSSQYMLRDSELRIGKKKGFNEFPYCVPRWTKTSGETYGRGPGMDVLPDTKMVNAMMQTIIKGAQKTVDPPLMVTDDGVLGSVRLYPGGLTVVRAGVQDPLKPLITDARIDFGQKVVEDVRARIKAGFYTDQLQTPQGPQMTATEVNQRREETLTIMGPVLGRQHFEYLRPMCDRVFGILKRKGKIKAAPAKVQGKRFHPVYSSLIARAQRMSEGADFTKAITAAAPIINAIPSALDNLDGDVSFKFIMNTYGVRHKLMRSPQDIKKMRDARQQQQQKEMKQADQAHQAEIAGKVLPAAAQAQAAQKGQ